MSDFVTLRSQFLDKAVDKTDPDNDQTVIDLKQAAQGAGFSECLVLSPNEMCSTIYNPNRLRVQLRDAGTSFEIDNLLRG